MSEQNPREEQNPGAEELVLVQQAAGRDREAFGRLYDRYADRIYRYLYFRLGNAPAAEDLTAEVFVRAWEAIGGFDWHKGNFAGWLYRIAHNLLVDHFRTRHETLSLEKVQLGEGEIGATDRHLERGELQAVLQKALHRLTPEQQQVIVLRFMEGYSSGEVAEIMGKSNEAVRAMQYRALASLARILGGENRK
ncbi:MAG: sigma-70 family RNA polymerase sigma factor [Chloroflexi bacterium]|nr:sigma-70 family RNA polymerase sigma factor [Chloroflexota bacterium]